jgi:hypothetical protein
MKKVSASKAATIKSTLHNTDTAIQKARILKALQDVGSAGLSTIELREQYNVMHPAGRVQELRENGNRIDTVRTIDNNSFGFKHSVARYVLISAIVAA